MISPRWYQTEAEAAVWQHLCHRPGNPLVSMPTGSGKSLVIAMLAKRCLEDFKGRSIVLVDSKELIVQNHEKIQALLPNMDVGIYSAGLKSRDTDHDIIVAGIQSVCDRAHEFGNRHLIITDEAHMIPSSGDGRYLTFFKGLQKLCPNARITGLTATPFRTGEGKLCRPDAIFQEICYTVPMARLIAEGFLSNLTTLPVVNGVDTSNLHIKMGEFVDSEAAALWDDEAKINAACFEIVSKTTDRRSTLIFCPSVYHAERVQKRIQQLTGEECGLVTGGTLDLERSSNIQRFRDGQLKRLANVKVLTTGFDAPGIDAIAVLRATNSPGLFAQICGRGLRTSPGKRDCLILDFGENVKRHGPLDAETYGFKSSEGRGKGDGTGEAPVKVCPACERECPISAAECECGWLFPEPSKATHGINADGSAILEKDVIPDKWLVEEIRMSRHVKRADPTAPNTLRVDYLCQPDGITGDLTRKTISEWVCLEHPGYAQTKARLWWSARSTSPVKDIDDAIDLWQRGACAMPFALTTRPDKGFTKIISVQLDEKPTEWQQPRERIEADASGEHFGAFDENFSGPHEDDVPF